MNRIAELKNVVQEYAWGSTTFLPELLGEDGSKGRPQAELWMGAHPSGPSMVAWEGLWVPLTAFIEKDPEGLLGKSVARRFSNSLPFLFKVLAAAKPLSIQAHPDDEQTRKGFSRENRLKVPLHSPRRNYRDRNHKPELLCALGPFWALKGFRKVEEILTLTQKIGLPALEKQMRPLERKPLQEGMRESLAALLTMARENRLRLISDVIDSIHRQGLTHPVFAWIARLRQAYPEDAGALSPIFMNLLCLQPGEAIYIPPGELHTYLEGPGIELMANSDNVLRMGLTAKHVDVSELLRILDCSPGNVEILKPANIDENERCYPVVAPEFALSSISVRKNSSYRSPRDRSVEIMICVEGKAHLTDLTSEDEFPLPRGTSIIVPAAVSQYAVRGEATLYKASVPL